jgi:hypothetical protein
VTLESETLNLRWNGVVHRIASEYDKISYCGSVLSMTDYELQQALTLSQVDCMQCLVEENAPELFYRCACSWIGGDPDYHRGKATCPACWHHDKKRVRVEAYTMGIR